MFVDRMSVSSLANQIAEYAGRVVAMRPIILFSAPTFPHNFVASPSIALPRSLSVSRGSPMVTTRCSEKYIVRQASVDLAVEKLVEVGWIESIALIDAIDQNLKSFHVEPEVDQQLYGLFAPGEDWPARKSKPKMRDRTATPPAG